MPLKLDLSPAALAAGNADPSAMGPPVDVNVDLGLTSLPSPVTLVPKTARPLPNDPNVDLFGVGTSQNIAASVPDGSGPGEAGSIPGTVGMKTTGTVEEAVIDLAAPEPSQGRAAQLGDSADKPIELDLEASYDNMGLFGGVDTNHEATDVVDPSVHAGGGASGAPSQLDVEMGELFTPQDGQTNVFRLDEAMGQSAEAGPASDPSAILASLASRTGAADGSSSELSSLLPGNSGQSVYNNNVEGLPEQTTGDSFPGLDAGEGAGSQFDLSVIDLASFSGLFDAPGDTTSGGGGGVNGDEMDLVSQFLAMDEGENVNPSGN